MSTRDSPGGKGGRCVRLMTYHPCSAERQEIRDLNLPGPPWAISTACCGRDLYLYLQQCNVLWKHEKIYYLQSRNYGFVKSFVNVCQVMSGKHLAFLSFKVCINKLGNRDTTSSLTFL